MTIFRVFLNFASWLSQGLNVLLLGSPDMTVSARCHIMQHRSGWKQLRRIVNGLFFWQEDHCQASFKSDQAYAAWVVSLSCGHHVTTRGPLEAPEDLCDFAKAHE